jgi:hypothetical protein
MWRKLEGWRLTIRGEAIVSRVELWGPYYWELGTPGLPLLPGQFFNVWFYVSDEKGTWTVTAHPRATGHGTEIMYVSDMSVQTTDIGEEFSEDYRTLLLVSFGNNGLVPITRFANYLSRVYY